MKPLSLKLRGAIGIRDGLGLNEVEIDFGHFGNGLVCITGDNGIGKSSILENMNPFLDLASRNGSLSNHFCLADSYRDFAFEFEGKRFRSLVLINAPTGRTEAYLSREGDAINDGRISTYKQSIQELLGSSDLFYQSVFVPQGARGITNLAPAKRKELFTELLRLSVYDRYSEYIKNRLSRIDSNVESNMREVEHYETELKSRADLEVGLNRFEIGLRDLRQESIRLAEQAQSERREHESLQVSLQTREQQIKERREKLAHLEALTARRVKLKRDLVFETERYTALRQQLQKDVSPHKQVLTQGPAIAAKLTELVALRTERKKLDELESQHRLIEQAEQRVRAVNNENIRNHERQCSSVQSQLAQIQSQKNAVAKQLEHQLELTKERADDAKKKSAIVDLVPCRSYVDLSSKCILLSDAICSGTKAKELDSELHSLLSNDHPLQQEVVNLDKALESSNSTLTVLQMRGPEMLDTKQFEKQMQEVGYDEIRHQEVRKRISVLEIEDWESQGRKLEIAKSILAEKEIQHSHLDEQAIGATESFEAALRDADHDIAVINDQLIALNPIGDLENKERRCRERIAYLEDQLTQQRDKEIALVSEMSKDRSQLDRLTDVQKNVEMLSIEIKKLQAERESWIILSRACSKDGIPALELDAAGPHITHIANELLQSSFGSRFQIAFDTLRSSKDGKKQLETFDILVYGSNGQKRIEDLSGGERVWIERAISEAIAIYSSQQSGHQFLTSFQDEADGALDPENKQNYLKMLQEALRLGRRYYTFLVTQTPEIWEQVDQRIMLDKDKGITLVY